MRLFGRPVPFTGEHTKSLSPADQGRGGWFGIFEPSPGAWQSDVKVRYDSVLSFSADFACRTLIASDISKLRIKLVSRSGLGGVWQETTNPAYSPVLRRPNHFQNRIQFVESWVLSKLQRGNTIVLKQRDARGVVTGLYVLDWTLVTPLVADSGDVFYQINTDNLSGVHEAQVIVPAREVIHDRFNCFFHPLIGLSPIFAGGLAATQGLTMQQDSTKFFQNGARPGGVLTAPHHIPDAAAARLKAHWEANYTGANSGRVAILGDGLTYEPMRAKAVDSQLIEQLKWSSELICSVYHVPPYKIGVGSLPSYNNIQALNVEYYSQSLQKLMEDMEICLDEGLGMDGEKIGVEFDTDGLLRMDSVTQMSVLKEAVGSAVLSPNEARRRVDMPPVEGGDSPYLQQQNYSLAALARRDARPDPFAPPQPDPQPDPDKDDEAPKEPTEDETRALLAAIVRKLNAAKDRHLSAAA